MLFVCETYGHVAAHVDVHVCPGGGHLSRLWVGPRPSMVALFSPLPTASPH